MPKRVGRVAFVAMTVRALNRESAAAMPTRRKQTRSICVCRLGLLLLLATAGCTVSVYTFCQPGAGEIVFGSELDASRTKLRSCSATFKQEGDFAFVGIFPRHITGTVTMEVTKDDEPPRTAGDGYTFSDPGNFYSGQWHLSDFPGPGHYVITMKLESEVLARGEFELTP